MTKKPQKLEIDQDFKGALEELRFTVENPNKIPHIFLAGDAYHQRDIRKIQTLTYGNWEIGYQVLEMPDMVGTYVRNIYFKVRNGFLDDLTDRDIDDILIQTKMLVDEGQNIPIPEKIAPDCMKISQIFMPMFLEEKSPKLVVPGGIGHA